mgnify:CR=1 FL=1
MSYVMVPVPAEFQREFSEEVMRLLLSDFMRSWNAEAIGDVLDGLDEVQQRFLVLVARASAGGSDITLAEVARVAAVTETDVLRLRREVNRISQERSHPELVMFDPRPAPGPDGITAPRNTFAIFPAAAELVLGAVKTS